MSEQPMTRRARREAERAAQRAVQAHAGRPAPAPAATAVVGSHRRSVRLARALVVSLLAGVTVVVPMTTATGTAPLARAAALSPAGAATLAPSPTASPSSVVQAVLGTDADLDDSVDTELSTVPDAATLARIREAYLNAKVTCAPRAGGASGDATAFDTVPTVFNPMLPGSYTISSPYGYRIHPTLGYLKLHTGQDFAAPAGTPIYAVAAGTVRTAGMVGDTGTITIEHEIDGRTWYTTYMHMYADGIYVHVGDHVSAGQLIAGVGSTGRSTGAHLHLEVWTSPDGGEGATTDPASWLREHDAVDLSTDCSGQ